MNNLTDTASSILEKALKQGADDADIVIFDSAETSISHRLGKMENIERAESKGLGLRVLIGQKGGYQQAIVSTTDFSEKSLNELVENAVNMAKITPEDKYTTLAEESLFAKEILNLDLNDKKEPSDLELTEIASKMEDAARSVKGVTNSEGAESGFSKSRASILTSKGFTGEYTNTNYSASVSVIAGSGEHMETDYDYTVARHFEDLKEASGIGRNAGEKSVKKLNPKKVKTSQIPLIFDPRTAKSLLGAFASAINGESIAKGTSFLKNSMETQIFAKDINIIDDPFIKRAMGSEPFDDEGVKGSHKKLIKNGYLTSWLLDLRSAQKLGLTTTGNASRGLCSAPHPSHSNLYMEAGKLSPKELMSDIKNGIYITELFGMGINGVTGDYSQGASGFWIENGEILYPVSEFTIASNLKDMFKNMIAANDLELIFSINSPTLRIDGMTVAGS